MAWKFGTIDFSTFGVMVSRSSGVLDLPKLKTEGYDWLNLDGRDYWQNEPKYNDREIVLNCWMYAEKNLSGSGYENFQSKIYAFTEAVLLQKKVDFETPYLTIPGCSIKEGVTVIRETNYVNDAQIGTFTLRITVQGASNYNLLNIYGYSTDELRAVVKTNNLIITKTLQGEMSASCSFESNVKLDIRYFDFIQVEYNGNGFDRFLLLTEPSFVKKSTNKYVYSLKFEHSSNWLSRSQLTISSGETDFYFYGDLEDVVDLIITSQTRASNLFRKGIIPATIKKNHKFSGEDCLSVLRRMCNEYDLEYEFKYIIPGYWYNINIAKQIANDLSVTLEFGKGKGQYELARGARIEDEFFTVLWAFGAAKNLKHPYRGGLTRLSFDGNPLQQNVGLYGYKEKTIYFDDVFPQRTAPVTAYYQVLPPDLTPLEKELYPNGIFRIYDEDFNFDLENYMIGGLTPKVRMKTGALAGHEFEIQEFKFDLVKGAYLFIIPFNDETGFIFPNATLKLAATDEYTLIDMSQPSSYEAVGENALQAAAIEELAKGSTPKYEYSAVIDPAFIAANPTGFEVGDRLTLIDADYNINGPFRIAALNYNDFTKIYNLTFSDKATLSRLKLIERQVQEHERTAKDVKDDEVETMRNRQQTPGELRRKLLDPSDEKLNVDNIVRNNSLDPRMLDLSAGTLQWGIHNALVDVNIGGDFDKAEIGAGSITYHNYDGDTRRDIARAKELAIPYDPTRTWDIPATDFNLETSDPHWMYLRIPLDDVETECEVIVSKDHIDAKDKIADNIIYLKIGGISSSASPRFAYMIWGNVKPGGGIPDAPNDGKTYGRKNKTWAEIIGGADGGSDVESGDGMDFITNDPVTLGLPSTIDSTTENAVTETSHTHKLGTINTDSVVKGKPVEYGALYNWWAATDVRNIAPVGFHVPTKAEWYQLGITLSGLSVAGGHLKEIGTTHWNNESTGADNSSGFNGRGSGVRYSYFSLIKEFSDFWNIDEFDSGTAYSSQLSQNEDILYTSYLSSLYTDNKYAGLSLRFIADSGTPTTATGNDGKVYPCVTIGTQTWTAANSNETKYRNGDWITGFDDGVYTPISDIDWAAKTTEAMCYYDDDEENGGGEVPLETLLHPPVTIHPDSASRASIDGNQVLKIEVQGGAGQSYQVLTAKDIEAGTAQAYDLIIKARQDITIESIVVECDDGTLTGCTVTIGATAITFASGTFSVSTTITEIAATANNVASAGDRVKINTSTGYTGTPTVLNVQLNYTVN